MDMEMSLRSNLRFRSLARRGLSMIEALIAAALLLVIAAGILPLFSQAIVNNQTGSESSSVSNMARSQVEELYQLPFNHAQLTPVSGAELTIASYYSFGDEVWKPGAAPVDGSDPALWERTAVVRQYSVNSLDDNLLDPAEALDAGAPPGQVHFKEIEVTANGTRTGGPLGPSRIIAVRMLKSQ
jgi:type II secretory pathway pseudopilin PulG